jgi:hypothetical protein
VPTKVDKMLAYCISIAEEFESRLNRIQAFVKHNLTSGTANETILRDFLSSHAPGSFVVGQGFICDPLRDLSPSKQCDILVYEQNHFPLVYSDGLIKVVLPRAARMVIEVKTRFDEKDVWSSLENIESAKKLNQYLTGIVFAFHSPKTETVIKHLQSFPRQLSSEHGPTAILLLDKDTIIHNWGWQRHRELEASPDVAPDAYAVRFGKQGIKGLVVTTLLAFLFQSTESEIYEADMINMLLDMFREYTDKGDQDVLIGAIGNVSQSHDADQLDPTS